MNRKKQLLYISLATLLFVCTSVHADAVSFNERSWQEKSGIVACSAVASIPYFASKMIYCLGGGIVAGGINLFSLGFAQDEATTIGRQAINGDWIIPPSVLTKERKLEFIGREEPFSVPVLVMNQD